MSNPAQTVYDANEFLVNVAKYTAEAVTHGIPVGPVVTLVQFTLDSQMIVCGTIASSTLDKQPIPAALISEVGSMMTHLVIPSQEGNQKLFYHYLTKNGALSLIWPVPNILISPNI